ncbi:MAG: energy-coupling factor transporter transmembrane protein EcfT [Candidatus Odinarchaeota archaeon]|nr:energy-coupling factor transporter transmembrane protein EcfT [Candidatus Odinarchaeota archaeon]
MSMSLSLFEAFRFKKKNTVIHNLDPRSKLIFTVVFSVLSIFYVNIVPLLLITFIGFLIIAIAKSVRELLASLKSLFIMFFLIFIFNFLYVSLSFALSMVLRLIALTTIFSVFFLTVHPDDLSQALIQMHVPFDLAFTFSMAIRFVPTLAIEAQTIMEAQMTRGLELQKGNIVQKARNYIPILAPLLISSIRRAIQIAESLDSRAFGARKNRTYLYELSFHLCDAIFGAIILVTLTLFVWLTLIHSPLFFYTVPF